MSEIINKLGKETRQLLIRLQHIAADNKMHIYPVGGFVRDLILKIPGKDIDFVVIGDALKLVKQFYKKLKTSKPVLYPRFGTAKLLYHGFELEFVTARQEYYNTDSRKPIVEPGNLQTDLSRRDFTINTLCLDISGEKFGDIVDYFQGMEDLHKGIIRTPLDPDKTFSDDPLRMMRAIRFATSLHFQIEPDIIKSIRNNNKRLEIISQERITDEFNKIILAEKPSRGINLLESTGLLDIFLPEFVETKGIEQKEAYHHKDVFYHTLQVLDQIAPNTNKIELRLAALFHDIAKPRTKRFDKKTGWTFHGHEVVGERMTDAVLKRMKYSNEIINYVRKLVRLHLRPMALVSEDVSDSAIRRLLFLSGEDFDDLMILCRADITSKNPEKIKAYLNNYDIVVEKARKLEEKDQLRAFKSPLDGNEIMKIFKLQQGPKIGEIKRFIEEAILDGEVENEHDAALNFLISNKDKFSL